REAGAVAGRDVATALSGSGPIIGLASSAGGGAPGSVVRVNRWNETYVRGMWQAVLGMPESFGESTAVLSLSAKELRGLGSITTTPLAIAGMPATSRPPVSMSRIPP